MSAHKFPYRWTLKDAVFTKDKGTVFSCFACGGGSTMGYKLAGFDVIGCNEIDHRMMYAYCQNHNPKFPFLEPIQDFKKRTDLPDELFALDILDGSPPCSTFSMIGCRKDAWGVEKRFREGQASQILDRLFFDFIDLAERLQPKVVVAENVKGMLFGEAMRYVVEIHGAFDKAGYYCQHWLLDAQNMGVPQHRERVFFVCLRKDLAAPLLVQTNMFEQQPALDLTFREPPIPFSEIMNLEDGHTNGILKRIWCATDKGKNPIGKYFSYVKCDENKPCPTLTGGGKQVSVNTMHPILERYLNNKEIILASSFPTDYNFGGQRPGYLCSMCVPPVMIAQVASKVHEQWLSKI